jgi:hypothetical protein
MSKQTIADDTRRFILTSVPSVPYLEALLLLRTDTNTPWDPFRLARRLYIGETQALDLLQTLAEAQIARRAEDGGFTYSPATPELARAVDGLAETYAADLVGVTDLIHSRLDKRAQHFADAFRWRKEDK